MKKAAAWATMAVHGVAIGSLMLAGGCGRTARPAPRTEPKEPVFVPTHPVPVEPILTPPRVAFPPPVRLVEPPPPLPPLPPPAETKKYTVKRGDSLSGIALRHGVKTRELIDLNKIANPDRLVVGKDILLPANAKLRAVTVRTPPAPVTAPEGKQLYTVVRGDSLSKIAARFGTATKALKSDNKLESDVIRVGQKLVVPMKAAEAAPDARGAMPPDAATDAPAAPETPAVKEPEARLIETAPAPVFGAVAPAAAEPAARFAPHDVGVGETLESIAASYAVPVEKLMAVNNLTGRDVKPGMTLKIPQSN